MPLTSRLRTPPLALRNVAHGGKRSLAAISGVAFSLTMVLLQLGFLEAVKITATNNFEQLDFDIVLLSPRYEQFYAAGFFPLDRLTQARGVATVVWAAPLYTTFNLWRCPAYPVGQSQADQDVEPSPGPIERWLWGAGLSRPLQRRELFVMGIDLDKNPFHEPIRGRIEAAKDRLRLEHRVLLNEQSHPDFGWQIRDQVRDWELGNRAVTLVGGFPMLRGFAADSTVICSDRELPVALPVPSRSGQLRITQGQRRSGRGSARRIEGTSSRRRRAAHPGRDPGTRDRSLGEPDIDRPALRVRRVGGHGRSHGGCLPGTLKRRARALARVCDAQGHGLLAVAAGSGGR